MVKRILIATAMLFAGFGYGQNVQPVNKLTLSSHLLLSELQDDLQVDVLIKGDLSLTEAFVREQGGHVKFTAGDILSAHLSKAAVYKLNLQPFVSRIEVPLEKLELLNDVMVIRNNVDSAYNGMWPLEQGYDGTGVVIGVIDAPFDINHADFKDALGNTRIKYVWDQNAIDDGTSPDPYGYGTECDSLMIANGDCVHNDTFEGNYSHGSGVAGVAASSGMAANRYRGVAPNADLILVSVNFYENYTTNLTDAINYIYTKAAELNKPCVINTSLGSYDGSHDGKDLVAQTIDNLIAATNRRAFVAAAGNAGNVAFHLGYDVTATDQFTWFKKLSYSDLVYYQLFADEAEFNNVYFSIAADDPATWTTIGETPDYNVLNDFDLEGGVIDTIAVSIPGGSGNIYAQLLDGIYQLDIEITPTVPTYYWRFTTHGDGHFDAWNGESTTGFSNYVTTGLPDAGILPEIVNYKLPDTDQTIVSSWQCSDRVIAVGTYTNRDSMTNYYGDNPPFYEIPGELFVSSSHGPTRDGRIKPDLCATGSRILSTEAEVLSEWLISVGAANYMSPDGMHYLYNGTSFASPVVAGIAALYFQKNPDADYLEVNDAIRNNTKQDEFTGNLLPDNEWGYGKADAFRTLTGPWGCSPDDYTAPPTNVEATTVLATKAFIEWDLIPNALGYQVAYKPAGAALLKKKTFTNAKMLTGLLPNTEYTVKVRAYCDGLGISEYSAPLTFNTLLRTGGDELTDLLIYPNPAGDEIHIDGIPQNAIVSIYNLLGELITTILADEEMVTVNSADFINGMYVLVINSNESIRTQQIIISR